MQPCVLTKSRRKVVAGGLKKALRTFFFPEQ